MYEALLKEVKENNIHIYENNQIGKLKGLYVDNTITINSNIETITEKVCVLAEELGHYYTTVVNILDQSKVENIKQEKKARRWAVDRLIRVEQFIDAYNAGIQNRSELAEFLEVTEDFIEMAIDHFRGIYGYSTTIGEYTIIFSPLYVIRKFE